MSKCLKLDEKIFPCHSGHAGQDIVIIVVSFVTFASFLTDVSEKTAYVDLPGGSLLPGRYQVIQSAPDHTITANVRISIFPSCTLKLPGNDSSRCEPPISLKRPRRFRSPRGRPARVSGRVGSGRPGGTWCY